MQQFFRFFLVLCLISGPVSAQSLIRDAEIEHTLRVYGNPVFASAGLSPNNVKLFIVNDDAINAFVAGGSNIFLHTGLILACETPGALIGAMAHETGHIAGGHLARGAEKLQNAQIGTVIATVLGAAAMAGGARDVGAAVMSAGQHVAQRNMLSFSRANEQSADQAALTFLDSNHIAANGLLQLFERLRQQENRQFGTPDPYVLTHPLSAERVTYIRSHVMNSSLNPDDTTKKYDELHKRMIAKLEGFLEPTSRTLAKYPPSNHSLEARYARAIAYYRIPDLDKSLAEIDGLLTEYPKDPFFHEMKGQILFENGRVEESLTSYEKARSLLTDSPLINAELARVEMTLGKLDAAITHLNLSTTEDDTDADSWRLLAEAYGKKKQLGMSNLALAQEAALLNKPDDMLRLSSEALKSLKAGSPAALRAADLKLQAEKMKEKNKRLFD